MKKNKKVIIFLYRESIGELNVALPIITKIKEQLNIDECYFQIPSKDKLKKIDSIYKSLMENIGKINFGKLSFLKLLFKIKDSNIIIMSTDKCPHFELNQLKKNFPNSSLIMMHHAQSILFKENSINIDNKKSINEIYKPDFFLVGNIIDYKNDFYSKGRYNIPKEKVLLIGALNYEKEWILKLLSYEIENDDKIKEKSKSFKKTILVTTRTIHKEYMMEEDYYYQVNSIIELAKKYKEYLFIIKPHPREKLKIYKKAFLSSEKNLIISNLNTYKLCKYSDLVISFWSSVIQDCTIMNKLVIEFHRHSEKNSKLLIKEDQRFKSFFEYYGFCKYTNNKDDLEKMILKNEYNQSIEDQTKNIKDIFFIKEQEKKESINIIKKKIENIKKENRISKLQIITNFMKSNF